MARVRVELYEEDDPGDLGLDLEERAVRTHRRSASHKDSSVGFKRLPNPPKSPWTSNKLFQPRRALIGKDRDFLALAMSEVPGSRDHGISPLQPIWARLLYPPQLLEILKDRMRNGTGRPKSKHDINRTMESFAKKVNREQPRMLAKLGELGILSSKDDKQMPAHFVTLGLTGRGSSQLTAESSGLLRALGVDDSSVTAESSIYIPQLGLAQRPTYKGATEVLELFEAADFLDSLKQELSPSSHGQVAALTLGRLEVYPR